MSTRAVALLAASALLLAGCLGAPKPAALNDTDLEGPGLPKAPPASVPTPSTTSLPPDPSRWPRDLVCRFAPCEVEVLERGGEPWIAIDPTDPDHAVVAAMSFHPGSQARPAGLAHPWLAASMTTDGGRTWTTSLPPGGPNSPDSPFASYDFAADPMIAFANDGTVVFASLLGRANPTLCATPIGQCATAPVFVNALDLAVWRSRDGGATWKEGAIVDRGVGFFTLTPAGKAPLGGYNDRETIAVDPGTGTIHLFWSYIANDAYDIRSARSTDHGETWSEPMVVAGGKYGVTASALDDTVLLTFRDLRRGEHEIVRSADGGAMWSEPFVLGPSGPPNQQPVPVALWRAGDGMRAVLAQSVGEKNEELLVRRSPDAGVTWGEPVAAPVSGETGRRLPALAVDPGTGLGALASYRGPGDTMSLWVVPLHDGLPALSAIQVSNRTADESAAFDYMGLAASARGAIVAWGVRSDSGSIATSAASLAWSDAAPDELN